MIVILLQKYNKNGTYATIYVNYFAVIQYVKYHYFVGQKISQIFQKLYSFCSTLVTDKQRAQAGFVIYNEQELKYN